MAVALALAFAIASARAAEAPPLQSVREIESIASREPFAQTDVRAKGVVTWVDETAGRYFYVQDETGGIRVAFEGDAWPALADLVEVNGRLVRGELSPAIEAAAFVSLGPGKLPPAVVQPGEGLLNGVFNGDFVEVGGWVRGAEMITPTTLALVMNAGSSRIRLQISNAADVDVNTLIGQAIRARGVACPQTARGANPRLVESLALAGIIFPRDIPPFIRDLIEVRVLVAGPDDIQFDERSKPVDAWSGPLIPLTDVFRHRPGQHRGGSVRVRGQVVYAGDGIAYLSDGAGGLAVRSAGIASVRRGDWVEAVGFPDIEGALPILSDAMITPASNPGRPVAGKELPADEALDGFLHANYVTVRGQLLDRMQAPRDNPGSPGGGRGEATLLALQSPRGVLTAELAGNGAASLPAGVEVGSTIEVSGVCIVQPDMRGNAASFRLLVPGPDQISVVKPASFFTVPRLLVLLSIALGILLFVTLLAYFFARRNVQLMAEMREKQAVAAERHRLARDLHDTLEQGLTGIQFRLQSIGDSPEEASQETQESLSAVRTLIDQCHSETRRSIWNLRSASPGHFDLGPALERAARTVVLNSGIRVEMVQNGNPSEVPPLIEDNILRIGQEAVMNAVKHAQPECVRIEVSHQPDRLVLVVRDDGRGTDSPHEREGHFGLVGMRERAERIGAELTITSNPGEGTAVRVDVPLRSTPKKKKP